jgi:hypothetical protein
MYMADDLHAVVARNYVIGSMEVEGAWGDCSVRLRDSGGLEATGDVRRPSSCKNGCSTGACFMRNGCGIRLGPNHLSTKSVNVSDVNRTGAFLTLITANQPSSFFSISLHVSAIASRSPSVPNPLSNTLSL